MNPEDRLVVALDAPYPEAINIVMSFKGTVNFYKLGVSSLLLSDGLFLAKHIVDRDNQLLLDLKLYDTRDTVLRTMEFVKNIGAQWVTVHKDCSRNAFGIGPKVLAVGGLTDGTGSLYQERLDMKVCDGFVCSVLECEFSYRPYKGSKVIFCPGIRPKSSDSNNHTDPATPYEAIRAGADYIIVGRPILTSIDPFQTVTNIIKEIEKAMKDNENEKNS